MTRPSPCIWTAWLRNERGITLLMTLATLTLASALGAALLSLVVMETQKSRLWEDAQRAQQLARLGAERAVHELRRDALWYEGAGAAPAGATAALGDDPRAAAPLCLNTAAVGRCRANDFAVGIPHPAGPAQGSYDIELRRLGAAGELLPMCRRETCLAVRVRARLRAATRHVHLVAAKIAPYATLLTARPLVSGAVVRGSLVVAACEGIPCDAVRFTRAHPGLGFAGVDVPAEYDWGAPARRLPTPSYLRGRVGAEVPARFRGLATVHAYGYGDRLGGDRLIVVDPAVRETADVPRISSPVAPESFEPFVRRAMAARLNGDAAYVCAPVPIVPCDRAEQWSRRDLSDATQVVPFVRDTKVLVLGRDDASSWRCDADDDRASRCNALAGGGSAHGEPGVPTLAAPAIWSGASRRLRTDIGGDRTSQAVLAWRARVVFDGADAAGPAIYLGRAMLVVDNPLPRAPDEPAAVAVDSSIVAGTAGGAPGAIVIATTGGVHIGAHNRDPRPALPAIETVLGLIAAKDIDVRAADARPPSLVGPHYSSRLTLAESSPAPLISHSIVVDGRFLANLFLGEEDLLRTGRPTLAGVPGLVELLAPLDGVRVLSWRESN